MLTFDWMLTESPTLYSVTIANYKQSIYLDSIAHVSLVKSNH